ncbi:hypothetical protein Q3H58_003750 [Pseudomonas psychrotolerans]|nr:hypothetical protein [Pseudomonas psychrotolerans]
MRALGLGLRHPLHPVRPGFELELGVDVVALDPGDDLLEATVLALVLREHLESPALALGVARIHAEQIASEDRRLVATGAGADFQEDVAPVVGVLGQHHPLQLVFQFLQARLGAGHLFLGHLAQVRIAVLEQRLGALQVGLHLAVFAKGLAHRLEFGVLLGIGAELGLVADDIGVAQQRGQLLEAVLQTIELVQQRGLHVLSKPSSRAKSSWAKVSASTRPSADSFLSCTLGACISLLVRLRARAARASWGSAPLASCRWARASSSSRICSPCWR